MRRALIATGALAALLIGGAAAAEAASSSTAPPMAKNKPCVTVTEFGKVGVGLSKAEVAKIFGTNGSRESIGPDGHGYRNEVRSYPACKHPGAQVEVTFASGADLPSAKVGWASFKSWNEGWTQ